MNYNDLKLLVWKSWFCVVRNYSVNVFITWDLDPFYPIRWGMIVVLINVILSLADKTITRNNTVDITIFIVSVG